MPYVDYNRLVKFQELDINYKKILTLVFCNSQIKSPKFDLNLIILSKIEVYCVYSSSFVEIFNICVYIKESCSFMYDSAQWDCENGENPIFYIQLFHSI